MLRIVHGVCANVSGRREEGADDAVAACAAGRRRKPSPGRARARRSSRHALADPDSAVVPAGSAHHCARCHRRPGRHAAVALDSCSCAYRCAGFDLCPRSPASRRVRRPRRGRCGTPPGWRCRRPPARSGSRTLVVARRRRAPRTSAPRPSVPAPTSACRAGQRP